MLLFWLVVVVVVAVLSKIQPITYLLKKPVVVATRLVCAKFTCLIKPTSASFSNPTTLTRLLLTMTSAKLPNVIFVLGGPGAGKGTQCVKIVEVSQFA